MQSRLAEASLPKTRGKLATLLVHAARGVLANPTATPDDLCMFFFATADSGLAAEEAARDKAKAAAGAAVPSGGAAHGARAALSPWLADNLLLMLAACTRHQAPSCLPANKLTDYPLLPPFPCLQAATAPTSRAQWRCTSTCWWSLLSPCCMARCARG